MSVSIGAERIGRLLCELLGRKVTTTTIPAFPITGGAPTLTAVYATSEGAVVGACVCDLDFVLNAGAALVLVPLYEVQESAKAKKWEPSLVENFKEILNVCAQLFCEPQLPRVALQSVCVEAAARPTNAADLLAKPRKRVDVQLSIAGYGGGRMTVLT